MTIKDSEHTCEVVQITSIDKHPNADRLEIARFQFADGTIPDYQCVVGKGEFQFGDLAVYISDDSIVNTNLAQFAFLRARLDFKPSGASANYRVRAAKLRGIISTGMLIATTEKLGKDMSSILDVSKYESPAERKEREHALYSGPSPGLFQKTISRISSWFYTPIKIPDYSVVSLRKVTDYFKEGEEIIYTEKIHGSNIRFGKINGRPYIGSHHTEKSDSRPWLLRKFFPRHKNPGFYNQDVWSEWFYRVFNSSDRLGELPNNIVFFGELYGPGIQDLTYGLDKTQVKVFDAYDTKKKTWLSRLEVLNQLPGFLDMVYYVGILGSNGVQPFSKDSLKAICESDSTVGVRGRTDNIREGIVVRSADWTKAGKLVSERYLTRKVKD